ncbi:phage tail protein [Staphylococcus delphini]|uniref:phage tail protein n=1 Tax=Staphylococcus delphini TaxID=53344 RepID=UPI000BBBBC40|nr:phage tail protein [Staphylococcus delphini]PCF44178.1 phage tail protein [Staphylococcus delphini]
MSNKDYTVSADLKANTGKFKKAIKTAIQTLRQYEKTIARIKDVELKADDKLIKEKVKQAELALERIDGKKANATIDASTKIAETKLKNYEKALQFLDNKSVKTAIDLQDRLFVSKFNKTKAEINKLDGKTVNTELEVKDSVANNKIRRFKALLRSIPNRRKVRVDADGNSFLRALDYLNKQSDVFVGRMDRIAKSIRTFGTIGANMIQGTLLSSFSALIPIVASLVPAIMAVGNALAVVGGGAIGLAGAFSIAGLGAVAFGAMSISAIKMFNDGLIRATDATDAYQKSLKGIEDTWSDIIKLNADSIFGAMSSALNGLQSALKNLTPFISGVSDLVDFNAQKFEQWVSTSKTAKKAFESLNTVGVQIFGDLLNAAGRFGDGLINIFTQFMPLFKFMSQGLQNMSIAFQEWANKVSTQQGIQKFIDYVKVNLPIIGKIFGDTFLGIFNLFKAFGSNSQTIFEALAQMASKFRAWSEQVAQSDGFKKFIDYVQRNGPTIMSLIGNIIMVLVNFGIAMAPIGSAVLNVVTAIAEFVAKLFEAHPAVAQLVGIAITLGGALMAIIPQIVAVGSFIAPLATRILALVTRFGLLKTFMLLASRGFTILSSAFTLLTGPVGIVIGVIVALIAIFTYLWTTNENFRNFIIEAWDSISTAVGTAIQAVIDWFMQLWSSIQQTIEPILPILQQVGQIIMQVLGVVAVVAINALIIAFQEIWNVVSIVFQTIGTIISVAVQFWVGVFTVVIQFLSGDFSGAWQTTKNTIVNILKTIWNYLKGIWDTIVSFLSSVMNRIFSLMGTSWSQIWSIISSKASQIWSTISSKFSEIVSTVRNKMVEFYNAIKQKVQDSLNAVVNFAGEFMDAGRNLIMGLVNGVKNAAGALIDAVTGAVSGAIDKAKSLLGIKSPSRVFKQIGVYTMQGLGIGVDQEGQNAVGSVVDVARQLTKAFNPVLSLPSISDATSGLNGLGGLSANLTTQIQHTHSFETSPRMKTVRIEMRLDNDAIYGIVNDKQAEKHSIFEM